MKKKKKFANAVMVFLILVIAASGVLTVGKIQGWFEKKEDALMRSAVVKGVTNIERNGIGYTLNADTVLQKEDTAETKKGAQIQIALQENDHVTLNERTQMKITECSEEQASVEVLQGEIFGNVQEYGGAFSVEFEGNRAELNDAVFSVNVQTGSSSLNLYAGDICVFLKDGVQERVEAGEALSVVQDEDGVISYEIREFSAESLSEFQIAQAQAAQNSTELCFDNEKLQGVLDAREAEKQAALEASLKSEVIAAKEESETETGAEANVQETAQGSENQVNADNSGASQDNQGQAEQEHSGSQAPAQTEKMNICTISIVCDTILDNMENLDDGKEAYVPANGTILATSSVEFEEGETVFDVLKRVCEYAGIQLEYSWTPMYDSYYIEGINHLYEFDCGNESGWMYKVNGWFPNYGCSAYSLKDGDSIVWCYTCNGLGADVGGAAY